MREESPLKQLLASKDLYVDKTDPIDGYWRQRLLCRFEKKSKIDLAAAKARRWIRIVSFVIPFFTVMFFTLGMVQGQSAAFYYRQAVRTMVWWIKTVSPWGNLVFGLFVLVLTLLAVRRIGQIRGLSI